MTLIFSFIALKDISEHAPSRFPLVPATHPVDEDVSWQSGGGLLQAAEAVHHPAAVKGQRDLCQAASCSTEQGFIMTAAQSQPCLLFQLLLTRSPRDTSVTAQTPENKTF